MSFICKSVTDRQFLLNKSFTYFSVIYYIVKLQNYSSLDGRIIASKMNKYCLSLKYCSQTLQCLLVIVTSSCASISQENVCYTIFSTSNLYSGR